MNRLLDGHFAFGFMLLPVPTGIVGIRGFGNVSCAAAPPLPAVRVGAHDVREKPTKR